MDHQLFQNKYTKIIFTISKIDYLINDAEMGGDFMGVVSLLL